MKKTISQYQSSSISTDIQLSLYYFNSTNYYSPQYLIFSLYNLNMQWCNQSKIQSLSQVFQKYLHQTQQELQQINETFYQEKQQSPQKNIQYVKKEKNNSLCSTAANDQKHADTDKQCILEQKTQSNKMKNKQDKQTSKVAQYLQQKYPPLQLIKQSRQMHNGPQKKLDDDRYAQNRQQMLNQHVQDKKIKQLQEKEHDDLQFYFDKKSQGKVQKKMFKPQYPQQKYQSRKNQKIVDQKQYRKQQKLFKKNQWEAEQRQTKILPKYSQIQSRMQNSNGRTFENKKQRLIFNKAARTAQNEKQLTRVQKNDDNKCPFKIRLKSKTRDEQIKQPPQQIIINSHNIRKEYLTPLPQPFIISSLNVRKQQIKPQPQEIIIDSHNIRQQATKSKPESFAHKESKNICLNRQEIKEIMKQSLMQSLPTITKGILDALMEKGGIMEKFQNKYQKEWNIDEKKNQSKLTKKSMNGNFPNHEQKSSQLKHRKNDVPKKIKGHINNETQKSSQIPQSDNSKQSKSSSYNYYDQQSQSRPQRRRRGRPRKIEQNLNKINPCAINQPVLQTNPPKYSNSNINPTNKSTVNPQNTIKDVQSNNNKSVSNEICMQSNYKITDRILKYVETIQRQHSQTDLNKLQRIIVIKVLQYLDELNIVKSRKQEIMNLWIEIRQSQMSHLQN